MVKLHNVHGRSRLVEGMNKTLVALFVVAALAGCASNDGEVPAPALDETPAGPAKLDSVAAARAANNASVNLLPIGSIALGGEESDAWGDYVFVDRGSVISIIQMAFVNDSVEFSEVSSITATGPKDVKVSDDGNWLFLGNDEQASGAPLNQVGRAGGFYVYDISDKAAPVLKSYLPVGQIRGPHMVFYHMMPDGTELVLGANGDVSINLFDRTTGTLTEVARYAPNPVTDVNRDPNVIDAYYQIYTHDMFVMNDEVAGKTLMYTASWDAGVHIVDITTPSAPVKLGGWNDYPEGHTGNLHTVSTEWIDDRRITVGAVEVGFEVVGGVPYFTGTERSYMYVWDTTNLAAPALLGFWENPDGIGPGQSGLAAPIVTGDAVYSTHNLQLEQGRVYMAHYGLGVWVLDVSSPANQTMPQVLAFDIGAGNLWDVIVHHGVVLTSGSTGLSAFHFPRDELGPMGIHSRA
jgi:hypothetical protein